MLEYRKSSHNAVLAWVEQQPEWFIYVLGLALMAGVAYGDWVTGPDISFRLFYLMPVFLVTWRSGRGPGLAIATLNALDWILIREDSFNTSGHPALPLWNMTIEIGFFFVVVLLVDAIRRGLTRANELSETDGLTGAANRRYFREVLETSVLRAQRSGNAVALAYMDLDNFKTVNDSHGHLVGDRVLITTAAAIRAEIRQTDLLARLGGDEFAVVLPDSDAQGAEALMSRVRERLMALYRREKWPVTVSIGVVAFHQFPTTTDEIIAAADGLMYAVKYQGKNSLRVETWSATVCAERELVRERAASGAQPAIVLPEDADQPAGPTPPTSSTTSTTPSVPRAPRADGDDLLDLPPMQKRRSATGSSRQLPATADSVD